MDKVDSILATFTALVLMWESWREPDVVWLDRSSVAWGGLALIAHVVFG